jgi:hypothetical protein
MLRAWEAVLHARGGHASEALALLAGQVGTGPGDPVLVWARQAIQRASANAQRASRVADLATPATTTANAVTSTSPAPAPAASTHEGPTSSREAGPLAIPVTLLDPMDVALRRLGARLGSTSPADLESEVRQLMQSLSASGALQEAGRSERTHAVRAVLATLQHLLGRTVHDPTGAAPLALDGASGGRDRSGPPLGSALDAYADAEGSWRLTPVGVRGVAPDAHASPTVGGPMARRAVLEALRAGRTADALQLIGQARAREGDAVVRVLERLTEGAAGIDRAVHDHPEAEAASVAPLSPSRDDSLLSPLRFGLVLLLELSPRREARGASRPEGVRAPESAVSREGTPGSRRGDPVRTARRLQRTAVAACLLLAAIAMLTGNAPIAILLAGGAAWLLLR